MRRIPLALAALGTIVAVGSLVPLATSAAVDEIPRGYVPSGKAMFKQYCAACHGPDAKGNGPAAPTLKTPPPDLTTLAARNMGVFPKEYVENILHFGPGVKAHGSSDMPTWGSIFEMIDKNNERVVEQRIKNLTEYLASLQGK
jgi:mono/diheme cytochrome c family protein